MNKPRMRPVTREVLNPDDGRESRRVWLCVGCGCYTYADTAEGAYRAWVAKRARRWKEHEAQAGKDAVTYIAGKPFEEWPFPTRRK